MITPENCPILADSRRVESISKDMVRALRKLRRDLCICQGCSAGDDCHILKSYRAHVDAAVQEVTDEWNLREVTLPAP